MAPSFLLVPNYSSMAHCDAGEVEPSTPSDGIAKLFELGWGRPVLWGLSGHVGGVFVPMAEGI